MCRAVVGTKKPPSVVDNCWPPLLLLLLLSLMPSPAVTKAVMQSENPQTPVKTVGRLMMSGDSANKFDLVSNITEMDLQNSCTTPLIYENNFSKSLASHYESSVCTIIYNVSRELETKNVVWDESTINQFSKSFVSVNTDMYEAWKNVTSQSPTLKLLMEYLNEPKKWKSVCYNFNDDLFPYCKFLHFEVLLMLVHKESPLKSNAMVSPESNKIDKAADDNTTSENVNVDQVEITTPNDDTNDDRDEANIETDDASNFKINYLPAKQPVTQTPNEPIPPNSMVKNLKEDLSSIAPTPTGIKIVQPVYSNKLSNRQEESHFLLYFIIMTVLSMMFYLALYNKKKIIALLLEGRRSTNHRRRPNSTSYSKVETDDGNTVY